MRDGKPLQYKFDRNGCTFDVKLYYNKRFRDDNEDFRSYSIALRPDFTLVINSTGHQFIVNFDSKYKLKFRKSDDELDDDLIDSTCWEYDIYKMHTYRDALMKSLGSYVLYPGSSSHSEEWNYYVKPFDSSWDNREEQLLPSVGAIAVKPGDIGDVQLRSALELILDKIGTICSSGEIVIDPRL